MTCSANCWAAAREPVKVLIHTHDRQSFFAVAFARWSYWSEFLKVLMIFESRS